MDVAFVNRALGMTRGGGERWDLHMARELNKMSINVTMYLGCPLTGGLKRPISLPTKKVRSPFLYDLGYAAPTGFRGLITDIDRQLYILQLGRKLKNSNHDIVHVNGYPEIFRIRNKINCPMTIKLNGPPRSLFYDHIHPWKSSYSWLNQADEVIATGITVSDIEEKSGLNVHTVNPGVDTDRFKPKGPEIESFGPTILWVGRMVLVKDLTELVHSFNKVLQEHPDADLWLVGDGVQRSRIEYLVKELGIEGSVQFWGFVQNENLPPYYRAADIFALSSIHESFGMVLLEAMASGTPVVAPRLDYIPKIVQDGQDGLLYEKGDENDLATNLINLIEDSRLRDKMAERCIKSSREQHSWSTQARKLKSVFESVLETGNSSREM